MPNNFEKSIEGNINQLADYMIHSHLYDQKMKTVLQIEGDGITSSEDLFTFLFELLILIVKKSFNIDILNLEPNYIQYLSQDNINTLNTIYS